MTAMTTTATTMVSAANAEFVDMPMTARTTTASDDGGEVEDLRTVIKHYHLRRRENADDYIQRY